MKTRMVFLFTLLFTLFSISAGFALTAGDIAILAVNSDNPDAFPFVALVDIPENTVISFTDNAWNATTETWRTGEGTSTWTCPAGGITKGTVVYPDGGSIALAGTGDQVLAYEGTTAPTTNTSGLWLYGFSIENWIWGDNTNTSDLPTALIGASAAMTASTTEVDNAYFANGSIEQTAVSVTGTKAELLALFADNTKYYMNDTGPLTFPTYTITVNTGGGNVPPVIFNIVQTPSVDIESTDTVSVSADVTDSDGTVTLVQLKWGSAIGTYPNTINMTLGTGDTYTADTDIPAQVTGTTVYYVVYAEDDIPESRTSGEYSYTVVAPATTTIPYSETFDADLGDCYGYSVSGNTKYWVWTSGYAYMSGYNSGDTEEDWLILPGVNVDAYGDLQMSFDTWYNYGTDDVNNYLKLYYSTDYYGLGDPSLASWTEIAFTYPPSSSTTSSSGILDLSSITGTSVWFAFKYNYEVGSYRNWEVDNVLIEEAPAGPFILASVSELTGFNYIVGSGPSAAQTFTVSGTNLTNDIVITGTTDYEISLDDISYSSPITLVPVTGTVAETTIYVRLMAGLPVAAYNAEDITVESIGATGLAVTCSGDVSAVPEPADNLFFSEYIEGGSNNKALEIYNASGAPVDLSRYRVELYSNGAATPGNTLDMTGTLAAGDVYVIANSSSIQAILDESDVTATVTYFNGDDALVLRCTNPDQILDVIGVVGVDPGSAWDVAGTALATVNHTLVRKNTVTQGNTDWATSAGTDALDSEWVVYPQDTVDYLGAHVFGAVNEPPVIANIVLDPASDYTSSTTVSVSADVTDADGTVDLVELRWGTAIGVYPNTINMTLSVGDTYVTDSDIPAQLSGTTVYYVVYAEDNDPESTTSPEQSYLVVDPATPVLTVNPLTLTGLNYEVGNGPSASQTFAVSGVDLSDDIVITAPLNYEISLDELSWISPINLTPTANVVAETTIYVRLIAGLAVGTYNLEDITVNSTGAVGYAVTCSGEVTAPPPTTIIDLRPQYIDISTDTSESAILVTVENYPTDLVKYRIYNGGTQYNCWDPVSMTYITSTTYSNGPNVPGTPTTSSTWWIPTQRGNNATTIASYRDRLDPYSSNYHTVALPAATEITSPAMISKNQVPFVVWSNFDDKYVALAYDAVSGGNLISATSTAIGSGNFSLIVESGIDIFRIEIRDLLNNLIEEVTGTWPVVTVEAPVFDPVAGTYFVPQTVTITSTTPDAIIYYSTDSDLGPWTEYTAPLNVAATTTIWAYAAKTGMVDSPTVSASYLLPIDVADVAALRAGVTDGTLYHLTGEAVLTFQQSNRNQKWIQDVNAAILIDDPSGIITTTYNLYDGITGIYGTLTTYGDLLEFVPIADPGPATSTGNVVVPEVRTLDSLTPADQSKLIKVMVATLDYSGGNFTSYAQNIDITDATATITMRTFASTDYSGTPIPDYPVNLTCLVGQYYTSMQVSPRFLADFESAGTFVFGGIENIYDLPEPVGAPPTVDFSLSLTSAEAAGYTPVTLTLEYQASGLPGESNVRYTLDILVDNDAYLIGDYIIHHPGLGYVPGAAGYIWNGSVYSFDVSEVTITADQTSFNIPLLPVGSRGTLTLLLGDEDPTLPVELSSFTAVATAQNFVALNWTTQSETNLAGYYIYRNEANNVTEALCLNSNNIIQGTNTSNETTYAFIDQEVDGGATYHYWLQGQDLDGATEFFGPISITLSNTNPDTPPAIPTVTELLNAFPNPFNPSTTIPYSIKEAATVRIDIYNIRGQLIKSETNTYSNAGYYRIHWDGKDMNGNPVSSGVYYYRMSSGKFTSSKKVILMK